MAQRRVSTVRLDSEILTASLEAQITRTTLIPWDPHLRCRITGVMHEHGPRLWYVALRVIA